MNQRRRENEKTRVTHLFNFEGELTTKHGKGRIKLSIDTAIIVFKIYLLIILGIVIYAWFFSNGNMYKNDDWRTKTGRE